MTMKQKHINEFLSTFVGPHQPNSRTCPSCGEYKLIVIGWHQQDHDNGDAPCYVCSRLSGRIKFDGRTSEVPAPQRPTLDPRVGSRAEKSNEARRALYKHQLREADAMNDPTVALPPPMVAISAPTAPVVDS